MAIGWYLVHFSLCVLFFAEPKSYTSVLPCLLAFGLFMTVTGVLGYSAAVKERPLSLHFFSFAHFITGGFILGVVLVVLFARMLFLPWLKVVRTPSWNTTLVTLSQECFTDAVLWVYLIESSALKTSPLIAFTTTVYTWRRSKKFWVMGAMKG